MDEIFNELLGEIGIDLKEEVSKMQKLNEELDKTIEFVCKDIQNNRFSPDMYPAILMALADLVKARKSDSAKNNQ